MATDGDKKFAVIKSLAISGVSACIAETTTLPLDTAKVLVHCSLPISARSEAQPSQAAVTQMSIHYQRCVL